MAEPPEPLPTAEDLKKLTPQERIRRLRQLEELRRKRLEEERQKVEEEIARAEELIKETEEEREEEEDQAQRSEKKAREQRREGEEDLEQRVAGEKPAPEQERQSLYAVFERTTTQLERLYGQSRWDEQDVRIYQEAKEQVEKAQGYTMSERLQEEFGVFTDALHRLKYRR